MVLARTIVWKHGPLSTELALRASFVAMLRMKSKVGAPKGDL